MLSIQGVYDGTSIVPEESIPVNGEYEVIITFLRPKTEKRISPFVSEDEMTDYINNIGEHFYGD